MTLSNSQRVPLESTELRLPPQHEPAEQVEAQLLRDSVIRTLGLLPRRYAIALEAKYGDDLSVGEIAALLAVTGTAAQSLLARARDAFRYHWCRAQEREAAGGAGR